MDAEKRMGKRGFNANGLKTGSSAATKRIRRDNKRGAKAKVKRIIAKDE